MPTEEKSHMDASTLIRKPCPSERSLPFSGSPGSCRFEHKIDGVRSTCSTKVRLKRFEVITFRFIQVKEFSERKRVRGQFERVLRFLGSLYQSISYSSMADECCSLSSICIRLL